MLKFILVFLLFTVPAVAQTLEQQERANTLNKVDLLTADVMKRVDNMALEKKSQCLSAIANEKVCDCFAHKLPVIVNFVQYVGIVSRTKEDLKYDTLKPNDKMVVDYVRKARDECVKLR